MPVSSRARRSSSRVARSSVAALRSSETAGHRGAAAPSEPRPRRRVVRQVSERRLATDGRGLRARERDAARAPGGRRRLARARRPLGRRPGVVLAARDRRHGARVLRAVDGRLRRLARARVDDLVPRREGLDRAQLRAPLGRAHARTRSPRSACARTARASTLTFAELSREVTRLAEALVAARRRAGRPRRALPADVARGGGRLARAARTSARSRCRSSPASPRRPSRSGCRRARRRS